LVHSTPSITLPYPFSSQPSFFNSFQYTSLYALPSHLMRFYWWSIILFSFHPSPSSIDWFHCYKHVLYLCLYMIMLVFVHMFICGSVFHIWEKTCSFCVSNTGLLHLTWCPPTASVYLQTTSFSGWVKLHCVYLPQFHDPFISCRARGLFPKFGYCE
jgi:hypothetical protein